LTSNHAVQSFVQILLVLVIVLEFFDYEDENEEEDEKAITNSFQTPPLPAESSK
jgi:hypothetical protein